MSRKLQILLFIFPLIVLLFLLLNSTLFRNCVVPLLKSSSTSVLGVSNFDLSASPTKILDGGMVNFIATVSTDNSQPPVINATINFELSGLGKIGDTIQGPGICVKISELKAACTNVNIGANQVVTWTVPVTAKTTCSTGQPPALTMLATMATAQRLFEDTAVVTCLASNPNPTSNNNGGSNNNGNSNTGSTSQTGNISNSSSTAGSGNTTPSSSTTGTDTGAQNSNPSPADLNQLTQCYESSLLTSGYILLLVWLVLMLVYYAYLNYTFRRTAATNKK